MTHLTLPDLVDTPSSIVTDDGRRLDVPRAMTVDEFMAFPWPERERWELLEGVPVMSPAPAPRHQLLVFEIGYFLRNLHPDWCIVPGIDVTPSGHGSYVCPDLVVLDEIGPMERPTLRTPKLAVEVLSPSNRRNDLATKFWLYQRVGYPEYWIADPATAKLTIYLLDETASPHAYRESLPDADGFAASRLLAVSVRLSEPGPLYIIEHRS